MNTEPWYAARCIFQHKRKKEKLYVYEERIILVKAKSEKDAFMKAENEAARYTKQCVNAKFTGFTDLYNIFDKKITDLTEIFSLLRRDSLPTKKYIRKYYDTKGLFSRTFKGKIGTRENRSASNRRNGKRE